MSVVSFVSNNTFDCCNFIRQVEVYGVPLEDAALDADLLRRARAERRGRQQGQSIWDFYRTAGGL